MQLYTLAFPRYITRAVIIPFGDSNDMSAAERVEADSTLKEAMAKAGRSAGVMISLGSYLTGENALKDLKSVVTTVEAKMDTSCHRLVVSYSWLMLATLKVCKILHCLIYRWYM